MNVVATFTRAAHQSVSLGDLLAARLAAALDRLRAWKTADDRGGADWRSRFLDWQQADETGRVASARLDEADAAIEAYDGARARKRLYTLFRLDAGECALADAALGLAADPSLTSAIAAIPGFRPGRLCERLVIEAAGLPTRPILRPASPLMIWSLVEGSADALAIDPDIAALVAGRPGLDRSLASCAEVVEPRDLGISGWPIAETAERIARLNRMERAVRVVVAAPAGSGRLHFATMVAEALSTRTIRILPGEEAGGDLTMRANRLALLTGHALYWDGLPAPTPPMLTAAPIQFLAALPHEQPKAAENLIDLHVELPPLSCADKREIWAAAACGATATIEIDKLGRLLAGARLADLIATAEHAPATLEEARTLLAKRVRARFAGAGNLLDLPYGLADLALAPAAERQLAAILDELAARDRLLASPGMRARYGQLGESMLFHGPPGTGKTMTAQVIARLLNVDLIRVDCATILSKFIGDTVKQLRELFLRVEGSGAVLLFDEADALFARRTEVKDAHDRHANADTSYLLQLIEGFDGVAILATNRRENIEPAFLRRLRHFIEFGNPGAATRARLWAGHFAALPGKLATTAATDWAHRLSTIELSPAQIKSAALTSLFVRDSAGRDTGEITDFVTGIERELAKDGRSLDRTLRARVVGHD